MRRDASDVWSPYLPGPQRMDQSASPRAPPTTAATAVPPIAAGFEDSQFYSSSGGARRAGTYVPSASTLQTSGVDIAFRGVSIAVKRNVVSECILRKKSRVLVRSAIGFFARGRVHAIASLGEESATALCDALSGRLQPVEGSVWADGLPVQVALYRESVGVVRTLSWAVPQFTVEENLHIAGAMRRGGEGAARRQKRVDALAAVLALDLGTKVGRLSASHARRVDVAMELMSSPPALFVHNPLYGLDCHSRTDFVAYLAEVARIFGTTVVITVPKLEFGAYDHLDSLCVLGAGGHTVFSGTRQTLAPYFVNRVRNPLHQVPTPVPTSSGRVASAGVEATPLLVSDSGATTRVPVSAPGTSTTFSRERTAAYESEPGMSRGATDEQVGSLKLPSLVRARTATGIGGMTAGPSPPPGGPRVTDSPTIPAEGPPGASPFLSRAPSYVSQQPSAAATSALSPDSRRPAVTDDAAFGEHVHVGIGGRPSAILDVSAAEDDGDVDPVAADLDGGDVVLDYVQLWADSRATDRYAAAFFDSREHAELDRLIEVCVSRARSTMTPASWLATPLVRPSVLSRFARLLWLHVKQRAVTPDWYIGWLIVTLAVALCFYAAGQQSLRQEGMFNVRGIIFFMYAVMLQLNGTLLRSYRDEAERFRHLKASGIVPTPMHLAVSVVFMLVLRAVYLAPVAIAVAVVLKHQSSLGLVALLAITSWAHMLIALVLVLLISEVRYAVIAVTAMDAAMIFFSGFLINVADSPAANFASLSLVRQGYGASVAYMLREEFAGHLMCDGFNGTSYCYTAQDYLELQGFDNDSVPSAIGSLSVVAGVACLVALLRLWFY